MSIAGRKFRGGAGSGHYSGRADYPYANNGERGLLDRVYAHSASTRNATPISKQEYDTAISEGRSPNVSLGSQAAYTVMNRITSPQGGTMRDLRSTYKQNRQAGLSPDASRGVALSSIGKSASFTQDALGRPFPR